MHSYLKSIGFSKAIKIDDVSRVIDHTLEAYDEKHIVETKGGRCLGEVVKYYAEGVGLKVAGEYDSRQVFQREYFMPFVTGEQISTREEITVEKRLDRDAFYGLCDDVRLGSTLIFSLQNSDEYIRMSRNNEVAKGSKPVILTGLAHDGMILFPLANTEKSPLEKQAVNDHRSLMRAAQEGDRDALESLTLEEFDTYSMIAQRIEKEDVLSIVNTYFIPSGIEGDEYNILGTITDYQITKNSLSGEELVIMSVEANDICVKICINRSDLVGEPGEGRRFKGNIWLQGQVFF